MPNPTRSDVHVNVPLTNISIAFLQDLEGFIADGAAPNVPVAKQSDRYFVYSRADWNRDTAQPRAPSSESAGGGWDIDNTPTYFAIPYAIHKDVDDQIRANADSPLNMDRDATMYVSRQLVLRKEKLWASTFFKTGVWTTEVAGVASGPTGTQFLRWDVAGSDPINDIDNQRIAMAQLTGFRPNKLAVSPFVFKALKNHAAIKDLIKYTQTAIVTAGLLASVFQLDKVLEPWAIENTAAKGATEVSAFLYGKHALLFYTPPAPSLMEPSAMYTFSWTGLFGAGAMGNRVSSFRMEQLKSDRIEGEMAFDMKLVSADLGVMFLNAVS